MPRRHPGVENTQGEGRTETTGGGEREQKQQREREKRPLKKKNGSECVGGDGRRRGTYDVYEKTNSKVV